MVKRRVGGGDWRERDVISVFLIRRVCGDMHDYNRLSSRCYGDNSPTDLTQNRQIRKTVNGSKDKNRHQQMWIHDEYKRRSITMVISTHHCSIITGSMSELQLCSDSTRCFSDI